MHKKDVVKQQRVSSYNAVVYVFKPGCSILHMYGRDLLIPRNLDGVDKLVPFNDCIPPAPQCGKLEASLRHIHHLTYEL